MIILLGLPCLVYLVTLGNGFVWDDHGLIQEDPWVHSLKKIPFLFSPEYWTQYFPGIKGQFRPVRALSFALQWSVWGPNPVAFHAFNLLIHLANVLLVQLLVRRLTGRREVAWLAALLFALHPMHTEAVAWVKNRSELLSLLFSLLAFEGYFRALGASPRWKAAAYVAGSVLCYVAAVFSKEMALTLPLLMLAYGFTLAPHRKRGVLLGMPHVVLTLIYVAFKLAFLQTQETQPAPSLPLLIHAALVFRTLATYIWLLVAPISLNADRPVDERLLLGEWHTWFGAFVVVSIFVLGIVLLIRRKNLWAYGLIWTGIALAPISNILFLHTRPLADQRLYYPSIGFCLLLALGASQLRERFPLKRFARVGPPAVVAALVLLTSFYVIRSISRNLDWKDDKTIFEVTVRQSPESARPHFQMGVLLLERGELTQAAREFSRMLELAPRMADAHNYLGIIYSEKKDYSQALKSFWRALQLKPDSPDVLSNMAIALAAVGKVEEAHRSIQKALELTPRNPNLLTHVGILNGRMGKFQAAIEAFDQALEIHPGKVKALVHRAHAYAELGDLNRSIEDLQTALSWRPENISLYLELADAYKRKGEGELARATLQDALALNPADPRVHNRIGNLLASMEQYEEAIGYFEKAVELAPNQALAYYNLGRANLDADRASEAEKALMKALEIEPENPAFHRAMADALMRLNREEEARLHIRHAQAQEDGDSRSETPSPR